MKGRVFLKRVVSRERNRWVRTTMKKCIDYVTYVSLLVGMLSVLSCQKEHEEVDPIDEQEVFMANSTTARLIERTVSHDGSFDNIVDGASCFSVQFPYTVEVNGVELILNTVEDLQLIESAFDADDDDENILNIFFPVTLIMADYSEVIVNSKVELLELSRECIEGGDDDDIECIDFVYPLDLFMFDMNNQQAGTVTVNDDREWLRFLMGLGDDELVSIGFPLIMVLYDDSEVSVNDNDGMTMAIESVMDVCDEDDDIDFTDDDFTQESLEEYLVGCTLVIQEVQRNALGPTDEYIEYALQFSEDGVVVVIDPLGNSIHGTWATSVVDYVVRLGLEIDALVDFNFEWLVNDIGEGKIKLYLGDYDKIVMRRACDLFDNDPDMLSETLMECNWIIKGIENGNVETRRFLGSEFNFRTEGVVILGNDDSAMEGEWGITTNAQGRLVLAMNMEQEAVVGQEWSLSHLGEDRLMFQIPETGNELVLERICDNDEDDEDVMFLHNLFENSMWEVAHFEENENLSTEVYGHYRISFETNGTIRVLNANEHEVDTGRWLVYRNSEDALEMIVAFDEESHFYPLSNDYEIDEVVENRLELRHENDWRGFNSLILERL